MRKSSMRSWNWPCTSPHTVTGHFTWEIKISNSCLGHNFEIFYSISIFHLLDVALLAQDLLRLFTEGFHLGMSFLGFIWRDGTWSKKRCSDYFFDNTTCAFVFTRCKSKSGWTTIRRRNTVLVTSQSSDSWTILNWWTSALRITKKGDQLWNQGQVLEGMVP